MPETPLERKQKEFLTLLQRIWDLREQEFAGFLSAYQDQVKAQDRRIEDLLDSMSWRLTAPLRSVHGRIFPATYYWRNRGIVVMTSKNHDGEAIAQCIQRFGYGAARGSSSRGGLRALAEMIRFVRNGRDTAFTIDGPRGPRYVAKQGPVLLALKTGAAIFCFQISMQHKIPGE